MTMGGTTMGGRAKTTAAQKAGSSRSEGDGTPGAVRGARTSDAAPDEARAEAAYRHLRHAILTNRLPAGFQAAETEIAAELGMSRTPVHEAMARLQDEGFVQILPRKGILVRALTPADLLEIYDVLIALEGAAAELLAAAAAPVRDPVLDALQSHTTAMTTALAGSDLEAWRVADEDFHDALVAGCGNGRIKRMAATVAGQSHRARRLTLHLRPPPAASSAEHGAIIAAVRAGDPAAAGEAARRHRRNARGELVPILARISVPSL